MPEFDGQLQRSASNATLVSLDFSDGSQIRGLGIFESINGATQPTRDSLPAANRTDGYIAVVKDVDKVYVFNGVPATHWTNSANWTELGGTGIEANDLSASVTWADVPSANITESSVTQHEAALTIGQAQVTALSTDLSAIVSDVASNTSSASANTSSISANATNITTNSTAISGNVTSIGTNATAISGNTADITSNATGISTNATGISTNATGISTNATGISTNVSAISTNATGIASNVTSIATNATGISGNTTSIGTNSTAISANATDISTANATIGSNTTAISGNTTAIGTNATAIATNSTAIGTNSTAISGNTTDIGTNTTAISANTNAISSNDTDIATNATSIGTNATAITGNTTSIATNATAIGNNTTAITGNTTSIGTNATAISGNATDIAANTTNIGTNTASISSIESDVTANDTDITNLQSELGATQTGAGLNANGTYTPNTGNTYTASATSLTSADDMLDAQVTANATAINNINNSSTGQTSSAITITNNDAAFSHMTSPIASGTSIEDIISDILEKYNLTTITFSSVVASYENPNGSFPGASNKTLGISQSNILETGQTLRTTGFNFSVVDPSQTTDNSVEFEVDGATLVSGVADTASSGSYTADDQVINSVSTQTAVQFVVEVIDSGGGSNVTISASKTAYWRNRVILGASSTSTITNDNQADTLYDAITQMGTQLNSGSSWNVSTTAAGNSGLNYTYIIFPASFGALQNVIQGGALSVIDAFTDLGDFTITNQYGASISYSFYRTNNTASFADGTSLAITF